jgi:ribulose-phosphate 3-epimerase
MTRVQVAPSLLSADPLNLEREVLSMKAAGADLIHLDIMDGHFVPSITYGSDVAERLVSLGLPLDVHLMVDCLDVAVPLFAGSASYLTVHAEATKHLHRVLQSIKAKGIKAGVALNPATPPDMLPYVADLVDLVLIMTVNPGWGGQKCITDMVRKVAEVRDIGRSCKRRFELEVDGGITAETAPAFVEAGATILVSGSYLFGAPDRQDAVFRLREGTLSSR